MSTGRMVFWGALVIIVIMAISGMNSITAQEEGLNAAWSQVENQYQRRMDLIPNLVETVKGYANFEKSTLTDVIEARANATKVTLSPETLSDPNAVKNFENAQGQLTSSLSRLMVVSERYPDLKANQNFMSLQAQLEGTENRIAVARRDYIAAVQSYNIAVRTFPGVLYAKLNGAKPKANFTASDPAADKAPSIKF